MTSRLPARLFCLLLASAVAVSGCGHHQRGTRGRGGRGKAVPAAPVAFSNATQTAVRPQLQIAGIIAPFQNVAVSSQLAEPALSVPVLQGDHVRAGQTLAVLDTADLQGQLASARGTLANSIAAAQSAREQVSEAKYNGTLTIATGNDTVKSARAALVQAQSTLRNDQLNETRDEKLTQQGYLPQQTLDQARTLVITDVGNVRTAEANLRTAQTGAAVNGTAQSGLPAATIAAAANTAKAAAASIQTQQGQIQNLEVSVNRGVITSPVDGIVVNRNLNAGEYPSGRTLFTVQELDKVYLNLNASSNDIFAIPKGAQITATVGGTTEVYRGTVNAVLGQVAPGSTNFTVQAIVRNPDFSLQAGMAATAQVQLPAVSGVGVPVSTFTDDTHQAVMRVEENDGKRIAHRAVVAERSSDGKTSIVSGLSAGTKVVTNGQLGITDGQDITLPTPAPPGAASASARSGPPGGGPGSGGP